MTIVYFSSPLDYIPYEGRNLFSFTIIWYAPRKESLCLGWIGNWTMWKFLERMEKNVLPQSRLTTETLSYCFSYKTPSMTTATKYTSSRKHCCNNLLSIHPSCIFFKFSGTIHIYTQPGPNMMSPHVYYLTYTFIFKPGNSVRGRMLITYSPLACPQCHQWKKFARLHTMPSYKLHVPHKYIFNPQSKLPRWMLILHYTNENLGFWELK